MIRGHAAEGLQWYEQALNLPTLAPVAESRALIGAGMMRYSLGELGCTRDGLTRALALAHDAGDMEMVAQAEHQIGHVEHAVGNLAAARAHFTRSVEGFRALAIPWGVGNSLNGMAKVALALGDVAEAERLLDEATSVLRHSGPWFLALVSFRRATLAVKRANPDEAIGWVRESLTLFRQLQDKFAIVYALAPLAAAAVPRATTCGRRVFWAPATLLRNARGPPSSTNGSRRLENRRSGRCAHASARIGGHARTRQDA